MSLSNEAVARAFSTHDFGAAYSRLSNTVAWNLIGSERLIGHAAVAQTCEQSAAYLSTVATTFTKFEVLSGNDFVVMDSTARYVDASGTMSVVASCDIYRFDGDMLTEITSYTAELPAG